MHFSMLKTFFIFEINGMSVHFFLKISIHSVTPIDFFKKLEPILLNLLWNVIRVQMGLEIKQGIIKT